MKSKKQRKIKLNKFRCFLFLIIIFLFSTGVNKVNLEKDLSKKDLSSNKQQSIHYNYHLVSEGETIWNIVDNYNYKGNKKYFVKEVLELNNSNSNIKPGDLVMIPMYEKMYEN